MRRQAKRAPRVNSTGSTCEKAGLISEKEPRAPDGSKLDEVEPSSLSRDTEKTKSLEQETGAPSESPEMGVEHSWLAFTLLLSSMVWAIVAICILKVGWLQGADHTTRIEFTRTALKALSAGWGLMLLFKINHARHRLALLLVAMTDARNVALLRVGVAGIAFLCVSCWTYGLAGYEDRELFDCGSEFCFPLDALNMPPTLGAIFHMLRIPPYTMHSYRWARSMVQVATVLMAVGFWCRGAALVAAGGLFYILGLRVSWTFGLWEMYGLTDNHIPFLLLFCAAYPNLSAAWSLDSALQRNPCIDHTVQVPASLHVAVFLLLGAIYFPPGLWKIWSCGLDWFLDESILVSHVSYNAVCGGLADGPPQVSLHSLPGAELLFQALGLGTIVFEVGFLPFILLCGSRPKERIILCACGFLFHKSIRLVMQIDFWSLTYIYMALIEWVNFSWDPDDGLANNPKLDYGEVKWSWPPLFTLIVVLVLVFHTYHGVLMDTNTDFPVCCYPAFHAPRDVYYAVGKAEGCSVRDTLWNLRLTLDPPMGGYHELDVLTDLVPAHMTQTQPFAVLIEQCLLHEQKEKVLKAWRHLLETVRVRLDPGWSGISVEVVAEARFFSRDFDSIAEIGHITRLPVQRYLLRSEGGGRRPLFLRPGGRSRLAVGADQGQFTTSWEIIVCGRRWDEHLEMPVRWAQVLPHSKGYKGHVIMGIGSYGMQCLEPKPQMPNSTIVDRQLRQSASRRVMASRPSVLTPM